MDLATTDLDSAVVAELAVDCLRWLLPLAPAGALMSYSGAYTAPEGNGATGITIPQASLKVLSVTSVPGGTHRYVEPAQFESIRRAYANGANSFGPGHGVWSVIDNAVVTFRDTASIRVQFLQSPAWALSQLIIPEGWSGLICLYCAYVLKLAEEELEQATLLKAALAEQLSRFKLFADIQTAVEG